MRAGNYRHPSVWRVCRVKVAAMLPRNGLPARELREGRVRAGSAFYLTV